MASKLRSLSLSSRREDLQMLALQQDLCDIESALSARAPAPLMADLPASTGSKTGPDSTWAEGHSFVNSCHRLPLILGAICALLPNDG